MTEKVLIVEGKSDKEKLQMLIEEPVHYIVTNGTASPTRIEELIAPYEDLELFVFVDADESGKKLRKIIQNEFPNVSHLYTDVLYREVATTPMKILVSTLLAAGFELHKPEILKGMES